MSNPIYSAVIADAHAFKEPERRSSGAAGISLHTLAEAIDLLKQTGYATNCYTTHLNEAKLKQRYGEPDEVTNGVEILDAAMHKTKCHGLRYDWLIIYVTDSGEVFAVDKYAG